MHSKIHFVSIWITVLCVASVPTHDGMLMYTLYRTYCSQCALNCTKITSLLLGFNMDPIVVNATAYSTSNWNKMHIFDWLKTDGFQLHNDVELRLGWGWYILLRFQVQYYCLLHLQRNELRNTYTQHPFICTVCTCAAELREKYTTIYTLYAPYTV